MRLVAKLVAVVWLASMAGGEARASDAFQAPTPEELAMKSVPGYPGAKAVVLFREETTTDDMHSIERYERVKILTEEGKQYANVELRFLSTSGYDSSGFYAGDEETVDGIQGRTIHADGTAIPFTGKPYLKTMEKTNSLKYQAKVFTLPDVEVGSIVEYRYTVRFDDRFAKPPQWYIQGDLFVRRAHYVWRPWTRQLQDGEGRAIDSIAWFPILPQGAEIKHVTLPAASMKAAQQIYELTVNDVPPLTEEDYMPPLKSFSYRVLFSYTPFSSHDEYWKAEGKDWSKRRNAFMKPGGSVEDATRIATAGATTTDAKLRAIYASVMTLENTDYTRERQNTEQGKVSAVGDVLASKRGSSRQLTELFVAMARSAGMKAYVMLVPDGGQTIFVDAWLSFDQFNDEIAIVNVDGKEVFLDPGERYCPYGHLAWQHSMMRGLRQAEGGTAFADTGIDGYAANRTARVANLTMDEHGQVTGKIDLAFTGVQALHWRHVALSGDEQGLDDELRKWLESRVPSSLELKVTAVQNAAEYEQPLKVTYAATGTLGAATGKRLVVPADLFESGSVAKFSQEKREAPIDFEFPETESDALRLNFAPGLSVEALPKSDKYALTKRALYTLSVESTPTSFTTRRTFVMGEFLFMQKDYPELRTFYSQLQSKDKESVVLKAAPAAASATGN